jgi:hypothetical protein
VSPKLLRENIRISQRRFNMLRRDFFKLTASSLLVLPLMKLDNFWVTEPEPRESSLWIQGSPYLGHSDYRHDFRQLTPDEIRHEIVHFRTEEPWRRMILFGLERR